MTLNRIETFEPLISAAPAASGERTAFQATVVSQPERVEKFRSVESSATASASAGTAARGAACEPQVTMQREGDRVTGIRVQCSCGQVIDLACVY
jgi:hypothetical protein